MSRLYSFGAGSFTGLAFVLAVLLPLAVPDGVLADAGSTCSAQCQSSCSAQCNGDPMCMQYCLSQCGGTCCQSQCGSDPNCPTSCCQAVCGNDPVCQQSCLSIAAKCMPDNCTMRDSCKMLGKNDCGELTSCGLADGCVDLCTCQPLNLNCDCQQKK